MKCSQRIVHPPLYNDCPIVADVLFERIRQIEVYGHTADADDQLPIFALPERAQAMLMIAVDNLRGTMLPVDEARALRKLIQSAATLIAAAEQLQRRQDKKP